jgi:hypothetical protein
MKIKSRNLLHKNNFMSHYVFLEQHFTVKKRLVSHFENFLVVASRCLAVAYFPKKRD